MLDLRVTDIAAGELEVVDVEGVEAIAEPYAYSVRVATALAPEPLERRLLARTATLILGGVDEPRIVRGVVRAVESAGIVTLAEGRKSLLRLEIVPRLALLGEAQRSRIFQDFDSAAIARAVLDAWGIPHRFLLHDRHGGWPYCVQHDETDLAFLERVLAADGIHYVFEPPPDADDDAPEVVVLGDGPASTDVPPAPPELPLVEADALLGDRPSVRRFVRRHALAPTSLRVRGYTPENARFDVLGAVRARGEGEGAPPLDLHMDQFLPERPAGAEDPPSLDRTLRQLRRRSHTVEGESDCRALRAGQRFVVIDEGGARATYIVTRARIRAHAAWFGAQPDSPSYLCAFEGVPVDACIAPPLPPRRRRAGLDLATVVGPPGAETHTDAAGRVKVQFRWDLDRPPGEHSSCWMRVAQGWTGAGFGAHFLPRVGMEVLVGYVDGDINRPLVVGCLANSTMPGGFHLPGDQAKSGVITRSTPDGLGFNELSFDDTRGKERVVVRAERDIAVSTLRDRRATVGRDDVGTVHRDRWETVERDRRTEVRGDDRATVGGAQSVDVAGSRTVRVAGAAVEMLAGGRTSDVAGSSHVFVAGDRFESTSGRSSTSVEGDTVVQLRGAAATVVGAPDARSSWLLHVEGTTTAESTGATTLRSDERMVLACGDTEIALSPRGVHIKAETITLEGKTVKVVGDTFAAITDKLAKLSSKKVLARSSDGGAVELTADAKVDGAGVELRSPITASDADDPTTSAPPTRIRLEDREGRPIPGERYVLVAGDGTRSSGVLDRHGEALIAGLSGEVEVLFPDLREWTKSGCGDAATHGGASVAATDDGSFTQEAAPPAEAIGAGDDGWPHGG